MTDKQWPSYDPDGQDTDSPWGREPTVTPSGGVPLSGTPTAYHPPPTPYPGSLQAPLEGRRYRSRVLPAMLGIVVAAAVAGGVALVAAGGDDGGTGSTASDNGPVSVDDPVVGDAPSGGPGSEPSVDSVEPAESDPTPVVEGPPDVLSEDGYADLVAAVEERSGGTAVFEAVLYPEYAIVDLPVDGTTLREESLHWDGAFDDFGGKGTAMEERIDLARVDPAVLLRLVEEAKGLVDDPTTTYVIIRGRSTVFDDDGERILAYATNDFDETAYVAATRDGKVVNRYSS